MILVDTGLIVALYEPRELAHTACGKRLKSITEPLVTTLPVLTEAFHILSPDSVGAAFLRRWIVHRGLGVHYPDDSELARTLELMEIYLDHPMDFADSSIIAAAEVLGTRRVFTLDRNDFETYRVRRGHRTYPVEIV